MACHYPIKVPLKPKGASRGVSVLQEVGCGKCSGCRAESSRQWTVRMVHEAQMHEFAWFVTLTYSNEKIPENGSLYPTDFRNFVKALRRRFPVVSYYGCGEYGDSTQRPHYHAVLFGPDFSDKCAVGERNGALVWRSPTLELCWKHGLSEFTSVNAGACAYVAGYVQKKVDAYHNPDMYLRVVPETGELVEVEPEFARMSLKPAIGRRWIERYWRDVYPEDRVVIDGVESKPPRYYDKWMDEHQPEVMVHVREKRWNPDYDDSPYKRAARESIQAARRQLYGSRSAV